MPDHDYAKLAEELAGIAAAYNASPFTWKRINTIQDALRTAEQDRKDAEAQTKRDRDVDWVVAIAGVLGADSGYTIPLTPNPLLLNKLFREIRSRGNSCSYEEKQHA